MMLDLRALFLTYSDGLRQSLTRQFGDPVLAADLVQDTFVRLAQAPAQTLDVEPIANMNSYLGRIARNLALNHFRQQRQRRTSSVDCASLEDIADDRPSAEVEFDGRRRLDRLQDAMATLPERTQQVFKLTRLMGMTYPEAAQALSISESSVQKHLARALSYAMRHAG